LVKSFFEEVKTRRGKNTKKKKKKKKRLKGFRLESEKWGGDKMQKKGDAGDMKQTKKGDEKFWNLWSELRKVVGQ